jgi:hypothetical protein
MLKDYMSGINLKSFQEQAAEYVLQGVQAELEKYLNRWLEPREVTESVRVHSEGYLMTTKSPIVSLPDNSNYDLYGGRIWYFSAGSVFAGPPVSPIFTASTWGGFDNQFFDVTYTAGYDARPENDEVGEFADVRLGILRVASREMTNRHDDTLSVKSLSMANEGEPTGPQNGVQGWTMDELRLHDRLRKRVIV